MGSKHIFKKNNESVMSWNYPSYMPKKCLNQQSKKDSRSVINRVTEFIT